MGWKRYRLALGGLAFGALSSTCAIDDRQPRVISADGSVGVIGTLMPQLQVVPDSINLGPVIVGAPARARVRLTNTGSEWLDTPTVAVPSGGPAFSLIHNQCEAALAPGDSCELRLQLLADRTGGIAGQLLIAAAGSALEVPLTGVGHAAGALILAPAAGSSDNFGAVRLGTLAPGVFNLTNPGTSASGPLAIHLYNDDVALVEGAAGSCVSGVTSLAPGQTCDVHLEFGPTRRGAADAMLVVTSDAAGSVGLPLTGRGVVAGSLGVSQPNLDFDGVVLGDAGHRALRVTNEGDEPLVLEGVTLEGDQAAEFSILSSDCTSGRALPAGAGCDVTAEFRPMTSGEGKTAALSVAISNGSPQTVQLLGAGLEPGSLVLAPSAGAAPDFGPVLLGDERTQVFQVVNGSAQTSGPLALSVSGDFELEASSQPGDCENGVTSLEDSGSCSLRVKLAPLRRAAQFGSISIRSPLAKSASLGLSGTALAPARLTLVQDEINFGRVLTGGTYQGAITLQNRGDEPLPPPTATLVDPSGAVATGFSVETGCTGPLAFEASCPMNVRFQPAEPGFPLALLRLESAPGGSASALVFGEVSLGGTLVLVAAEGDSPDFGDVGIGSSKTGRFTLENPGNSASGRLSITVSSPLFSIEPGDCNPVGGNGLESGASCAFGVIFTPLTAEAVSATLSIQSPGAGGAALSITGQGRSPANVVAVGNRDFGTANIGQQALTDPRNDFTWTVTNEGDLPTGTLQVTNSNSTDFAVATDGCNGQSLMGHGGCDIAIRFRPVATGALSGDLIVLDTASSQAVTLKMTGSGVQLAQPGESCVNATCATGECTGGVCCDRACVGGCQECSPTGVCIDQDSREECGDGSGVCFGVDRCLLPDGEACSGDNQCGSGNCERRLGGTGPSDQVCCAGDCGTTGDQCSPDGAACREPTLGAGAACGAAGQLPCGNGLLCKACLGGGNQCTPANACCGGCPGNQVCTGGSCACPAGTFHCGGGLCIQDRANACCPATPECSDERPLCDPADNLCKECLNSAQCGPNSVCSGGSCACAANARSCSDGRCIGATQCCDACAGPCQTCNGSTGNCGTVPAGQPGRCPGGQVCGQNGQCNFTNVGLGQACNVQANNCSVGTCVGGTCACSGNTPDPCGGNRCVNFDTDPNNCGGCGNVCGALGCNGQGVCNCPTGQVFVPGLGCRLQDNQPCTPQGVACRTECVAWFASCDGDNFPASNTPLIQRCGTAVPTGTPQGCAAGTGARFVRRDPQGRLDCCDASNLVHPDQTVGQFVLNIGDVCPPGWKEHDYNCDNVVSYDLRVSNDGDCSDTSLPCAQRSSVFAGPSNPLGFTPDNIFNANGDASACGNSSLQWQTCEVVGNACQTRFALAPRCE